jgi:hypothetical protein
VPSFEHPNGDEINAELNATNELLNPRVRHKRQASCTNAQDLFDPSGNYISSVCYIVTSLTNANAATACQSLGHKLLTVTTTAEGDALNAYTQSNFGATWYVWMSGRLIGSTWTDSNDGSTPVPTPSMPTDTSRNGDCLRYHISMGGSQYHVSTWNCSDPCDSYCEFVNPNPVTPTTTTKAPPTCANKQDLFDTSGNYISSVCKMNTVASSSGAVSMCGALGYTFFTITSDDEGYAFNDYVGQIYSPFEVLISGRYDGFLWVDSNDAATPLFYDSKPSDYTDDGSCLLLRRLHIFFLRVTSLHFTNISQNTSTPRILP